MPGPATTGRIRMTAVRPSILGVATVLVAKLAAAAASLQLWTRAPSLSVQPYA